MNNREHRNNYMPGSASHLTAESFKARAMQAANEMLDDIENMADLAILIENKVKEIVGKFDVDFEDCELDECSAVAFMNRSEWEFDPNENVCTTPELMYSWKKNAYMYALTIWTRISDNKDETCYRYRLNRMCSGKTPEILSSATGKWTIDLPEPTSLDIARAFLAECPEAEEQDLDFLDNAATVSGARDVQDLRRIMENSMKLMQLYRRISDFMDIDCISEDDKEPYLMLIPDDPFKCGCAVCEREGQYVLRQCFCVADLLDMDPDDDWNQEISDEMMGTFFVNEIAATDNAEELAYLLEEMFGAYRKSGYCVLPLSMQAYCCIALPFDAEPEFYTLNNQDLTKEEVENFLHGIDGLANILPE